MKMRNDKLEIKNCRGKPSPRCNRFAFSATPSADGGSGTASTETRSIPRVFFWGLACLIFSLFSCATMQDDMALDSISGNAEISAFEMRFSEIDSAYFEADEALKDKNLVRKAEVLLSELEKTSENPALKKAFLARVYALSGCLAFDMGKKSLAKKHYESSVEAFKGDARALILARRLGIEKNFDEKTKQFSDKSLLILEKALVHYSGCNYEKALASFDEAFLSLEPFYRQSYGKLRDKSWQLRSVSGEKGLVSLEKLSVLQMILLTNQNPDLLYTYTAGKELSEKDLYKKIAGSGLLNPVSQPLDAENAVTKETSVTRLIAARFLWNLYNQRRNTPQLVTKYSEAYKNKKRSPILDVKLDSPDFDAVLGCVENEIMHLEDGIEFGAEKEVSGIEFNESLGKIK